LFASTAEAMMSEQAEEHQMDALVNLKSKLNYEILINYLRLPFCFRVSDELLETNGRGVLSFASHCPTLNATTEA
jgi:hypothetical protein